MNQRDIDRIIVHDARGMPIKRKEGAIYKDNTLDPTINQGLQGTNMAGLNTVDTGLNPVVNTGFNPNLNTGLVGTGLGTGIGTGLSQTTTTTTTTTDVANENLDPNHKMTFKEKLTHKYADWKERRRQKKLAKEGQVGTGDLSSPSSSDEDKPSKTNKRSTAEDKALSYDRTSTLVPGLQAPMETLTGTQAEKDIRLNSGTGLGTGLGTGFGTGMATGMGTGLASGYNTGYNTGFGSGSLTGVDNSLQPNIGIVTDNLQPNVAPSGYVGSTLAGAQGGLLNTGLPGYNTGAGIIQGNIPQESRKDRAKTGTWEFPDQRMSQVSQTINTDQVIQQQPIIQAQPIVQTQPIVVEKEIITTETTEVPITSTSQFSSQQWSSNVPVFTEQQNFNTGVFYNEGFQTAQNIATNLNQNIWAQPQTQFIPSTGICSQNIVSQDIAYGLSNQANLGSNIGMNQNFQQANLQNVLGTGLATDVSTGMASFGKGISADVSQNLQSGNILQPGMVGDLGTGLTNFGSSGTTLNQQPSLLSGGRQAVNSNIPDIHTNLPTGSSQ